MRPIQPPPVLPSDNRAYFMLMKRCIEAQTREELSRLQTEIVQLEGGRFKRDFTRFWWESWLRVAADQPIPPWPEGGRRSM